MEDKRFENIIKDPKFRRAPKSQSKVKIDQRFQSMFTDKKFQVKYSVDKRGRPVKFHSNNDLKRYYEISSEDEDSNSSDEENTENGKFVKDPSSKDDDKSASNDEKEANQEDNTRNKLNLEDKNNTEGIKDKLKNLTVDYARGEQRLYSESSSDDEESDEEVSESEEIDHKWGELDGDAEQTGEITSRLAACNLDWDRIRAIDLMVLFNSFLPLGGIIKSVGIYPSEFGKQRLKEEETKGPTELIKSEVVEQTTEEDKEEGSKYHMEKLRQYQLNRLKYYYAVVTFDSAISANKIYTECDGMEYESSATKLDLRFIPDDMSFDNSPKEFCDKLPNKYEPRFFTTTALQQAKVELTWDETDPDRLEFTEKMNAGKLDNISKQDLQNYLAGSSDEEDNSEPDENDEGTDSDNLESGNSIEKYKALLQDIEIKDKEKQNRDVGLEISWGMNLKAKTDKMMKDKAEKDEEKNPFQKYLDKRKDKRKEKKKIAKNDGDDDENSDIPADIDMNDPYFAEEFNKSEFKPLNKKKNKKQHIKEVEDEEAKQDKAELDLILMGAEDSEEKKHFNLKNIQKNEEQSKKKRKKASKLEELGTDDFKIDVEDKRFSALFTSHHYNIDPTDPHYKKTKAMESLIDEKIKRRNNDESIEEVNKIKKSKLDATEKNSENAKLNMLVKNVRRKALPLRKK